MRCDADVETDKSIMRAARKINDAASDNKTRKKNAEKKKRKRTGKNKQNNQNRKFTNDDEGET